MLKIIESIKCLQNKGQKRRQKLAIFEKSYLFGLKQSEVSKCQISPHNPQLTMKMHLSPYSTFMKTVSPNLCEDRLSHNQA